jgi:hypothetical protein
MITFIPKPFSVQLQNPELRSILKLQMALFRSDQSIEIKQFLSMRYSLNRDLLLLILKDNQTLPKMDKRTTIALYQPNDWILDIVGKSFALQNASNDL